MTDRGTILAAIDTADLEQAAAQAGRLGPAVGGLKLGLEFFMAHGAPGYRRVAQAMGAKGPAPIFLDLKFHDIPNSVGLAVREAARHGAWMVTVHVAGGPAMMAAAAAEARAFGDEDRPCIVGVSVLTSLDQHTLTDHLGVGRTLEDHMVYLSKLAVDCDLDGVVCSAHEIAPLRAALGPDFLLIVPGIRPAGSDVGDQRRVMGPKEARDAGASILVIGRPITAAPDPGEAARAIAESLGL